MVLHIATVTHVHLHAICTCTYIVNLNYITHTHSYIHIKYHTLNYYTLVVTNLQTITVDPLLLLSLLSFPFSLHLL